MRPPKKLQLIVSVLILLLGGVIAVGVATVRSRSAAAPSCRLTFLDVGQGDAVLIQTPDGQDLVIDGGPSAQVSRDLGKYLGFGNNEIEAAILTHPDSDHLTGMLAIVQDWPVQTILTTGVVADTELYRRWHSVLKDHAGVRSVVAGQRYQLGAYLTIDIIWPDRSWDDVLYTAKASDGRGGINDTSVGTKITCAGSTALMIGDAPDAVEEKLLSSGADLRVDLLKISHHGSKYSSAHDFLRAVHPDLVVIPVGLDNSYGHPHPTVLERLRVLDIPVDRTDTLGTIEFESVAGGWKMKP